MFIKCFRTEVRKAFLNKMALFAIIIEIILVVVQVTTQIGYLDDYYDMIESYPKYGNPQITIMSLFCRWIGADVGGFEGSLFFFLLPIFAVLPYGWSQAGELQTGYVKNILCRVPGRSYFRAKYAAVFVSACFIVIIPLLLNYLVLGLFLPALPIDNIYPYGLIGQKSMWSWMYSDYPHIYSILYIFMDGIFAGLISLLGFAFSFFVQKRIPAMLFPFFVVILIDYANDKIFQSWEMSPVKFLRALPVANNHIWWIALLSGMILFVGTFSVLVVKERKYEAL